MSSLALISIFGRDRVGLVAAIADHLFDIGVNLRDASFATLGSSAEFIALCELPPNTAASDVEADLSQLPELEGAQVRATAYNLDPEPTVAGQVTHRITISGGDQLGLVARLADVFRRYAANFVRLEARKLSEAEGGLYVTRFAISLPPEQQNACLATVTNTAGTLNLTCTIQESRL
jgi:glycine cleavage system transcriptional repressor